MVLLGAELRDREQEPLLARQQRLGRGWGRGKRGLDRVENELEDWTDWAFVFRRSIKANCLGAYEMMVKMDSWLMNLSNDQYLEHVKCRAVSGFNKNIKK